MLINITKFLCVALILLVSGLTVAVAELQSPPNISDAQKTAFASWKKSYLLSNTNGTKNNALKPSYINELVLSQSPYLKQHANNPINWKPWSRSLLDKAKQENKLIFLSIGYASCHWCHVMNEESFSSVDIAKAINKDFYAIKVDREELPHIDSYYMSALQALKHSGGWPITVVINGDGLPVFIDSYLSKQKLERLLPKIHSMWQQQPDFLLSIAKNITSMIDAKQSISSLKETIKLDPNLNISPLLRQINSDLVTFLDAKQGGFKGRAKFPSEYMLLYALDQLLKKSNPALERLVKLQLDKMMEGELYDHVSGGFHRYATRSNWTSPHFEKTLYNQSQLVLVYAKAYQYFHNRKYLDVVQQTTDFMFRDFKKMGELGFMSAIDADHDGKEGDYYLWNKKTLKKLELSSDIVDLYKIVNSNKVGILFKTYTSQREKTKIDKTRNKLLLLRRKQAPPRYDDKVITGWNGLAIKALLVAGTLLKKFEYIDYAKNLASDLWTNRFNKNIGKLRRNVYPTTEDLVYLSDYAYLADGLIALYDITNETEWLTKAKLLESNAVRYFENSNGEIFNNSQHDDLFASKNSTDTNIISPYSVMLSVKNKLARREDKPINSSDENTYFNHLFNRVSSQPIAHLSDAKTLSEWFSGTTDNSRYFARSNGKVKFNCVKFSTDSCQKMEIEIQLKGNWHINSNRPLQDHLIATRITPNENMVVNYPNSALLTLGFQKEPISVFSGISKITLRRTNNNLEKAYLTLPLQACNDHLCLLPEKLKFVM